MNRIFFYLFFVLVFFSCVKGKGITEDEEVTETLPYSIVGNSIHKYKNPIHLKGVNAFNTFGIGDSELMNQWNVKIVREYIGNLKDQPISGDFAILGSDNFWYHSLQKIVDSNRVYNRITILCPFAWVDSNGNQIFFTGLNPRSQPFYNAYKQKMRAIAEHFKNQPDVWVEIWNEPYHWNNENGYTHNLWFTDAKDMVDNLRSVADFENIILVPGNQQGQSENAIILKGADLLTNRYNLLFDLHAYEKWTNNSSVATITQRINTLKNANFAIIFGEVGVENAGNSNDPSNFLEAVNQTQTSTLGWLWKWDSSQKNALLNNRGLENNNSNFNWGSSFKTFLNN